MIRLFFVLLFAGWSVNLSGQNTGPVITWEKASHDFGDMIQGEKQEYTFKFRNTGNAPLIITNVQVTCGCTTPKGWTRDPVNPGQSSELTIAFNSIGKYGRQNKVITIVSNAVNPEGRQISFTANVLERKSTVRNP
ncbi:MAG: DUF1573 domain-containing protein [Bacteroidetes bacterium]|nr:DUF1573 domain-containing protein [Bacteroidota bacterium]